MHILTLFSLPILLPPLISHASAQSISGSFSGSSGSSSTTLSTRTRFVSQPSASVTPTPSLDNCGPAILPSSAPIWYQPLDTCNTNVPLVSSPAAYDAWLDVNSDYRYVGIFGGFSAVCVVMWCSMGVFLQNLSPWSTLVSPPSRINEDSSGKSSDLPPLILHPVAVVYSTSPAY